MTIAQMTEEIVSDLKAKFNGEPELTDAIIESEVKGAIRELKMKRNYVATSMSEDDIEEDIENYYSVVKKVAEAQCAKLGAEGEQSHSENGISRYYVNEDELWKGVHAFVRVF